MIRTYHIREGPQFPNATIEDIQHNFGIERNTASFRLVSMFLMFNPRIGRYDHYALGTSSSIWRWVADQPTRMSRYYLL